MLGLSDRAWFCERHVESDARDDGLPRLIL
jgi:hypothetical protein